MSDKVKPDMPDHLLDRLGAQAEPSEKASSGQAPGLQRPSIKDSPNRPQKQRSWRLGRCVARLFSFLILLGATLAATLLLLPDRRIEAPDWVRDTVERRLDQTLGGVKVEFGEMSAFLGSGWLPGVSVRDVTLRYPDGTSALQVADAQAVLSLWPLLKGQVRPKAISLSGLFASLERSEDGAVALRFGEGNANVRRAASFAVLMEQWDQYLTLPVLSALTQIETNALTLRLEDLRLGREWTLDGGAVSLGRNQGDVEFDASFSVLSGRNFVSTVTANYRSQIGDTAAEFALVITDVPAEDVAVQSAALGWLSVLRAPISGAVRGAVDSDGALRPLQVALEIGEGVIQPEDAVTPVPIRGAQSFFTFDPSREELTFESLRIDSGWGRGTMQGTAALVGVENGQLRELVGQLAFSDLELNPNDFYDQPIELAGVTADFLLELNPFRVRLGQMLIERDGLNVVANGEARVGPEGWDYDLTARSDLLTPDLVKALWPTKTPPNPRKWVRDNVLRGVIYDVEMGLRGRGGQKPFVSVDLSFRDAEVKYHKTLPNLVGAAGQLSIHGSRLAVTATEGFLLPPEGGPLEVSGTSFIIPDTALPADDGFGIVRAAAEGTAVAVLSVLNTAPLSLLDKVGLPVDLGEGRVALKGTATVPLRRNAKIQEIDYHYAGVLRDVRTDTLLPGHVLESAALRLRGDPRFIEIFGPGQMSGIPVDARWRQDINPEKPQPGRVSGTIELSNTTVETLGIGVPDQSVFGRGTGTFEVTLPPDGAAPRLSLSSTLAGVGLRLPDLSWSKSKGSKGLLKLEARLGASPVVEDLLVEAPGLRARGQVTTRTDGGLERAVFSNVSLGGWLKGAVTLEGRGAAAPAVTVRGGQIDLRNVPFDTQSNGADGAGGGGNVPIALQLDQLRVTDDFGLNGFQGRFSTQGGFNGEFSGRLNGQAPLTGVVVPQQGGLGIRLRAEDAGAILRAAGVIDNSFGGDFEMTLLPMATPGEYKGQLRVGRIRVKQGARITALLNAISLVGLVDELSGQGIQFTSAEADFKLGPQYLTLTNLSAIGVSIGLTMEGIYNLKTDALDMRGVLTPLYALNGIGSILTRRGEGLLAFAFRMRGTGADPDVRVNPLSALAPGFLREVFRGEKPRKPGEERKRPTAEERREELRRRIEDR
ncbi:MAG: DUF3971 domain-containing protein [Epibacterium sp.]|nr:DUF3971 domain-containing protein [Epibacterium sp.]NQX72145.1 DUF3971 domain-containing protein [Epibacterium sp.]